MGMRELNIIEEREVLNKNFKMYGTYESPLFLAKDVANWIEHKKPNEMIANVDEEEKQKIKINHGDSNARVLQNNTEYWFLTEDGLYEVLMQSRKPIAKQFKKEVKKILKSVRKHGAYMTDNVLEKAVEDPDFMIGILTKLKEEKAARIKAEEENNKLLIENEAISLENRLLSGEEFSWANKSLINALVRKYSVAVYNNFGKGWTEYKKSLLYKYSINLNGRITNYLNKTGKKSKPKTLDMLDDTEISNGISVIISMCRENKVDITDIIKHYCEISI